MRTTLNTRAKRRGQTLPIVGLLLATGVLIGFLAIAIDGGSALLQRRTMQNGADASVLAVAHLLASNTYESCNPSPCHPTYAVTDQQVANTIASLTGNNRGGTYGATNSNYGFGFAYHYISGAPTYSGAYGPTVTSIGDTQVPDFVDGLVVTNTIANPSIFASIKIGGFGGFASTSIRANSAARLYPACPPPTTPGRTLPFTRFLPALQYEMTTAGNDPLHPFPLWSSDSDISNDGQFKNMISLSVNSMDSSLEGGQQLLTQFDTRYMSAPFEDGYLCSFADCGTFTDCTGNTLGCANLAGSVTGNLDHQDIQNWLFWRWRGTVSTTNTNPPRLPGRPGDWAQTYHIGDRGSDIYQPLSELLVDRRPGAMPDGVGPGPLSGPPWNYGMAITLTVFTWGQSWDNYPANYSDDGSYAQWRNDCSQNGQWACSNPPVHQWDDLRITGGRQGQTISFRIPNGPIELDRVRFTRAYKMAFYKVIVDTGGNSLVRGFMLSRELPDPPPGSCTWQIGGSVYSRQVSFP